MVMFMAETELKFEYLWENGPRFAQAQHFKLGTDSVLLADFVRFTGTKRGIDLGCASGALALLLLTKHEKLHMTGLEILPEAAELAKTNMVENSLQARSEIICGDIRRHRELFKSGSFELVLSNPPYFPENSGFVSPKEGRANARAEGLCTLDDLCAAASFLLKTGGSFNLVHKPERLSEVFCAMAKHGLEPKRLRMVCHTVDKAPNLVLIEGRRGGKPGLVVEPNLVLRNPDNSESDEVRRIYHR